MYITLLIESSASDFSPSVLFNFNSGVHSLVLVGSRYGLEHNFIIEMSSNLNNLRSFLQIGIYVK